MTDQPPGRAYEHVQRKLTEQERTALRESLATHGLRDPITLDQHGDIIDGYNREDLCRELGIAAVYRVLEVADPVHWIRHNQTARRNLSEAEMRNLIVETKAANPEASTRAIAEKLGANPRTVARALEKSGVTHDTPVKGKDGKTYKPKSRPNKADRLEEALRVYDRRKWAGEPISEETIAKEMGASVTPGRRAIAVRRAEEAAAEQAEIILSASMQEKFDAKIKTYRKNLDYEIETKAQELHRKWREENSLPNYFAKLEEVENLLNSTRWAVMPLTHYKLILACLHPDNSASKERRDEAFTLFNSYKLKLVDLSQEKEEKDRLKRIELRGNPLPRTVEEMLARKTMKRR